MTKDKNSEKMHDGHRERMRFRMERDIEMEAFNEHEMLEFLLFYAIPRRDTNEIAHKLINSFGSFANVFHASLADLMQVGNLSKSTAMLLKAVMPISRGVNINRTKGRKYLYTSDDAITHFASYFENEPREVAYVACLDIAGRVINVTNVGKGRGAHTEIDMQKVLQTVSSTYADKVVLMHNHPSTNLTPSENDIVATNFAIISLHALKAKLIDHIIFAPNGQYFSFYQNQIIDTLTSNASRFLSADMNTPLVDLGNRINYYDKGVRMSESEKDTYLRRIGDLFATSVDLDQE